MTITPEQIAQLLDVDQKNGFDKGDIAEAQRLGKITEGQAQFFNGLDANNDGVFSTAEMSAIALNPAVIALLQNENLSRDVFSAEERAGLLGRVAVAAMQTQVSAGQHANVVGSPTQIQAFVEQQAANVRGG